MTFAQVGHQSDISAPLGWVQGLLQIFPNIKIKFKKLTGPFDVIPYSYLGEI